MHLRGKGRFCQHSFLSGHAPEIWDELLRISFDFHGLLAYTSDLRTFSQGASEPR